MARASKLAYWNAGVWFLEQFAWSHIASAARNHSYAYGRKQSVVASSDNQREWKAKMTVSEPILKSVTAQAESSKARAPASKSDPAAMKSAREMPKPSGGENIFRQQPLLKAA